MPLRSLNFESRLGFDGLVVDLNSVISNAAGCSLSTEWTRRKNMVARLSRIGQQNQLTQREREREREVNYKMINFFFTETGGLVMVNYKMIIFFFFFDIVYIDLN
jgi:hypothetical protein